MIVVMTNVAQKNGPVGSFGKLGRFLQRQGALGSPPGVEMAAVTAAQSGSTPAAIHSLCCLVVQAAGVDRKALEQKGGSPADRILAMLGQFFQELLMAEERVRGPPGLESVE